MHIRFAEADKVFIQAQVEEGFYTNESELVRDAVRRLREQKIASSPLYQAVMQGTREIQQGKGIPFSRELMQDIRSNARQKAKNGGIVNNLMSYLNISNLELSPSARADIEDILAYTYLHYGEQQEEIYYDALCHAFETIVQYPASGHVRLDLPVNYRAFAVRKHLVIYVCNTEKVSVVRVLHSSMNVARHIGGDANG